MREAKKKFGFNFYQRKTSFRNNTDFTTNLD